MTVDMRVLDRITQGEARGVVIEERATDDDSVLVLLDGGETTRLFPEDGPLTVETTALSTAIQLVFAAFHLLDSETAHRLEDAIHRRVLHAIADGAADAAGLAREALKTKAFKFNRWYA